MKVELIWIASQKKKMFHKNFHIMGGGNELRGNSLRLYDMK